MSSEFSNLSDGYNILNTPSHSPDNTYEVLINGVSEKTGSLLEDFEPAVNPPKEISDPDDFKPSDWVDEAMIADPEAAKPEDWDEDAPFEILDEEVSKPEGWLDDEPLTIADPGEFGKASLDDWKVLIIISQYRCHQA